MAFVPGTMFWYYFCKMLDKLPSWDKLFLKNNKSSRDFHSPDSRSAPPQDDHQASGETSFQKAE